MAKTRSPRPASRRSLVAGAVLAALAAFPAAAQVTPPTEPAPPGPATRQGTTTPPGTDQATPLGADASTQPRPPIWRITPGITVRETWSDNPALLADETARAGWITEITPSVRIEHAGARGRLFLDYRLNRSFYSQDSRYNDTEHRLEANTSFEAVEDFLFLDGRAAITQENRSAFGAGVVQDAADANTNRVETRLLQASPNVRGVVGNFAAYNARFTESDIQSSDDTVLPRTRISELTFRARNATAASRIGWALDATSLSVRNDLVGSIEDQRLRGAAIYAIEPQLLVSALFGYESSDFGGERESRGTPGVGLTWIPSARTQFSGVYERRFFGNGYDLLLAHRTPRTAWRVAASREATVFGASSSAGGSAYALMSELLIASVPDPAVRADVARRRIEDSGIPAGAAIGTGFLTARPFVLENYSVSTVLTGIRNTITLTASRRDQARLGEATSAPDSFALASEIRQDSFTASWAYRLTPLSNLTGIASEMRSRGLAGGGPESRSRLFSLFIATRLNPRANVSFGFRHAAFDGAGQAGYTENALVATLTLRL